MPTINERVVSDKQLMLLYVVSEGTGNLASYWLDLDQILEKLSALGWTTTKDSLHFSIRSLIARGMIEKRSVRRRKSNTGRRVRRPLATTNKGRIEIEAHRASGRLSRLLSGQTPT